jgi:phosphoglycerol transferase MdoB-like AlkP superfamily enzyme
MSGMSTEGMPRKAECLLRGALGVLMVFAGISKLMGGIEGFVENTGADFAATWLPMGIVSAFLFILPVAELLLGLWLLAGWKRQWALFITGHLFVAFMFGFMILGKDEMIALHFIYILTVACALMMPSGCPFTGDPK